MAKLYVYDSYENRMLVYNNLNENDPMPYSYGSTLSVREFRGSSNARVLWTTTRAMEAWNLTRRRYGAGIPVGYAFKRIWEGGHGTASQHYAGVAFDVGQGTSSAIRQRIHAAATATRAWGYVEPLSMTPTWVHFDRRSRGLYRYGTQLCQRLVLRDLGRYHRLHFQQPDQRPAHRQRRQGRQFFRQHCRYQLVRRP